jgi:hypothetical protein
LGYHLVSIADLTGARPYFERALAIFIACLGPDHPHTQTVRDNLAALPAKLFPKTAVSLYNYLK